MADPGVGKEMLPGLRREALAAQLPAFLMKQRWFGGKARNIRSAELTDVVPIQMQNASEAFLLMVRVTYADGNEESYAMPFLPAFNATLTPEVAAASLHIQPEESGAPLVLTDALKDAQFFSALLGLIQRKANVAGEKGEIRALQTTAY